MEYSVREHGLACLSVFRVGLRIRLGPFLFHIFRSYQSPARSSIYKYTNEKKTGICNTGDVAVTITYNQECNS